MTLPNISKAVTLLKAGGTVAFPTETVYGLGADAGNESAIHKIYQAKNRPYHHPLIVHLAQVEDLPHWAVNIPATAYTLAQHFWPGPLTMVFKKQPHVLDIVTSGQATIGLRIPRHPVAQALLSAFGSGIAAPSANQFTHISPTTAVAVAEELTNKVDLILDGGSCQVGVESTIIDMTYEVPVILRPGMITAESVSELLGLRVVFEHNSSQRVPGTHKVHYAPTTKTTLVATENMLSILHNLTERDMPVALVARTLTQFSFSEKIKLVQMSNEAIQFAHDLYHTLRTLDQQQFKHIMIEAVPDNSEWDAIRDRIYKATALRN